MEPDSIFGLIEKDSKRIACIYSPSEYHTLEKRRKEGKGSLKQNKNCRISKICHFIKTSIVIQAVMNAD